jgi:osmoprotectant transport system ATP-binding protein
MTASQASTAESRAASVEFDHVTKVYGAQATKAGTPGAVNDLSLEVPAGRICVLVGPSGCGKTTTLKMVNRLIEPTSGRILLDGVDAATRDTTELRRGIGYVIQQTGLFPHQTIEDNVVTVPRLLGWSKDRMRARADELLTVVGLDPARYARRFPAQLSGGERQRVGVARALAADPPVMLMDEPFGAVDPIVRERLQNEFLRLQEQLAKTILFVTHDIDEAIKMGDLVAVFEAGGVVAQYGPPSEILANPASEFVARFVGTDRGLKRLSLFRVGEMPLSSVVTAPIGSDGSFARRQAADGTFEHVLVTDDASRPIGWVHRDHLTTGTVSADQVESTSPLLDRRTTLKDALSLLLDGDVQAGLVVDRTGALRGMITVREIIARMHEPGARPLDASQRAAVDADTDGELPDGELPDGMAPAATHEGTASGAGAPDAP